MDSTTQRLDWTGHLAAVQTFTKPPHARAFPSKAAPTPIKRKQNAQLFFNRHKTDMALGSIVSFFYGREFIFSFNTFISYISFDFRQSFLFLTGIMRPVVPLFDTETERHKMQILFLYTPEGQVVFGSARFHIPALDLLDSTIDVWTRAVCVCVCGWNRKEGSEKEMNRNGRPRTKRSNRFGNGSFNVVHLVTSIQPRRHSNQFLMKINTTARGEVGSSGEETTARLLNKINSRLVHARNRISII